MLDMANSVQPNVIIYRQGRRSRKHVLIVRRNSAFTLAQSKKVVAYFVPKNVILKIKLLKVVWRKYVRFVAKLFLF